MTSLLAFVGYLATVGAIASGSDLSYTSEEGIKIDRVLRDLEHMKTRFEEVRVS